jgi:tRNA pseudouridine(55) synthase
MQKPPMVSAVKKDGVPLYKLARKGVEVEREARLIHIYRFQFSRYEAPVGQFRVASTKGTYVRSLAHDLGAKSRLRGTSEDLASDRLGQVRRSSGAAARAVARTHHR